MIRHPIVKLHHDRIRVRRDDGERPHDRSIGPSETLPQSGQRRWLTVVPRDGIRLLATFEGVGSLSGQKELKVAA